MKIQELKVTRIGNSRGVRLPSSALKKYSVSGAVIMEERLEGILLRPAGPAVEKLSWEETAREMAAAAEDWSEWDAVDSDGLEDVPWRPSPRGRIGEKKAKYGIGPHTRKKAVKRYEVRWAALGPARGPAIAKTRPVVVVSPDELNARLQTVTVCPLTSQLHPAWRCRLPVRVRDVQGEVAVDQIRTIGKNRLGKKIGALSGDEASLLRRLITEMYGE